jgi:histidyl-tRNA synthetase
MKEYLEIILTVSALLSFSVGIIWKLANTKAEIYQAIDRLKDDLEDDSKEVAHKLDLHLIEYSEKKEFLQYRLNGIDELIKHKFNRCWGEIKDIQSYLSKSGNFQVRDKIRMDNSSDDTRY